MEEGTPYFNLQKYIQSVHIYQETLEQLSELQERFHDYLNRLLSYGDEQLVTFLTLELFNELLYSNQIEEIQKLLLQHCQMPYPTGEYRQVPVYILLQGQKVYTAPEVSDVPLFMRDFIKFFNNNSDSLIHNDPFIKAAFVHFLFIKIHPFVDGNGRVARVLQNLKFTELVNKVYQNKNGSAIHLKIAPVNISYSIYHNKQSYYQKLNAIPFYKGANIDDAFNHWLQFLLYMYDEQLYYNEHSKKAQNISLTLKKMQKK